MLLTGVDRAVASTVDGMRLTDKTTDSLANIANNQEFPSEIDFTSRTFILQNLQLAKEDIYADPTLTITSRDYISRSTCLQICFYISLALKSFTRPPIILLFGAGHTGSILVDHLVSFRLDSCLRIFARGDYATKYWKSKKLHASSSLPELLGENKADIVVMCSGMSSFGFICRSLIPFVSRATFFISSCFGLSRKRIFNSLRTPNVFRTYQEPIIASTKCDSTDLHCEDLSFDDSARAASILGMKSRERHPVTGTGPGELTFEQQSADLIVKRCPNLCNMIYLLENYYALRGMVPSVARRESINNLLGRNPNAIANQDITHQLQSEDTPDSNFDTTSDFRSPDYKEDLNDESFELKMTRDSFDNVRFEGTNTVHTVRTRRKKDVTPVVEAAPPVSIEECIVSKAMDLTCLAAAQRLLQTRVAEHFQKHFSKSIRVADIPRDCDSEASSISALNTDISSAEEKVDRTGTSIKVDGQRCLSSVIGCGETEISKEYFDGASFQEDLREDLRGTQLKSDLPEGLSMPVLYDVKGGDSDPIFRVVPETDTSLRIRSTFSQLASESHYDAKVKELEELRLINKAKMLEELDTAPKINEPIGAALHSDEELSRIFGEDSLFYEDGGLCSPVVTVPIEGCTSDMRQSHSRIAELVAMLNEIDTEDDKQPHEQPFAATNESPIRIRKQYS